MKQGKKGIRIVLAICAAMGWWGMLYPELTLTPDTCAVVDENGVMLRAQGDGKWGLDGDLYRELLKTDSGRIRFKSRLLTQAEALLEQWK